MTTAVENLLTEKHLSYTASGKDFVIRCLNPEHSDANPSLRIHKVTGVGHCFACGFKFNIFKHFDVLHNFQSIKVVEIKRQPYDRGRTDDIFVVD
jgi:DNA primase